MIDPDLSKRFSDFLVLEALHKLSDSAALTSSEAAVFLRISLPTLERLRKSKSGPVYMQGGKREGRGVNQSCTYLKSDLIAYQQSLRVTCSMGAAVRRGQAFMPYVDPTPKRSIYDLVTKRPFYIEKGWLLCCVDNAPLQEVLMRLGKTKIVWLNPIHAVSESWIDGNSHGEFASSVKAALEEALKIVDESVKVHIPVNTAAHSSQNHTSRSSANLSLVPVETLPPDAAQTRPLL